nr:MAG TPA: hypothetical protein [Caudoviricetes sp.]
MAAVTDEGRRIIDQEQALTIFPEDCIIIDSATNGTRQITYEALCKAVASTLGISNIKQTADNAMPKSTYDKNGDGIVDNASALDGHEADYFATAESLKNVKENADGAMQVKTYDSNKNGVVDNAEKVNSHTVESDVPAGAVFTDTVYDDTEIKKTVEENTKKISELQGGIGLSVVDGKIQQTITK